MPEAELIPCAHGAFAAEVDLEQLLALDFPTLFVRQAARQFELWTSRRPDMSEARETILHWIGNKES